MVPAVPSHPHAGDPVFDLHLGGKMHIRPTVALAGPEASGWPTRPAWPGSASDRGGPLDDPALHLGAEHESHLMAVSGDDTADHTADDTGVAIASLHAMGSGTLADFQALYTADAVNREAQTEPPDTRGTGPAAFYATARWLRTAFSDLTWKVHDVAHDNDLVVVHATMSGRQTGPFIAYRPDAKVAAVFPPRGRTFTVTQTHWFRMNDGKVAEHWASRDDLGMGQQLGWNPPTLLYLARMLLASRRARRR